MLSEAHVGVVRVRIDNPVDAARQLHRDAHAVNWLSVLCSRLRDTAAVRRDPLGEAVGLRAGDNPWRSDEAGAVAAIRLVVARPQNPVAFLNDAAQKLHLHWRIGKDGKLGTRIAASN